MVRLDDDSDGGQTNNAAVLRLKPGETGTCKAIFGYSWGSPSASIRPGAVSLVTIFSGNTTPDPLVLRIESLDAAGAPGETIPIDPNTVAVKLPSGVIFGPGATFDTSKQILAKGGAKATPAADNSSVDVTFAGARRKPWRSGR